MLNEKVVASEVHHAAPPFASWLTTRNNLTARFVAAGRIPGLINLAGGLPDPALIPSEALATIAREAILKHPLDCLGYCPTEGLPEMRDAIAARYSTASLRLGRSNVLITASGTQALDLVGKVLVEPQDVVVAPFPTYVGAMDAWRCRVPLYRDLVVDASSLGLIECFDGAKFVYAVPNFSNPTGKLVSLSAREALVAAAHRTGTWLVEDDPYRALQYDGEPLESMLELSGSMSEKGPYNGPVIYLGSASKELAPGLRVGWVVAAPQMIEMLAAAKQCSDLCSSGLNQRMVLAAMECGLVGELKPRMTALYRQRRDALCQAMTQHLSEWFEWEVPVGGMFVWASSREPGIDSDRLVTLGTEAGVLVGPSSVFDPSGKNRGGLRLNFTANAEDRLAEGVRRLAVAVGRQLS